MWNRITPLRSGRGPASHPTVRTGEVLSGSRRGRDATASRRQATGSHHRRDRAIPTRKGADASPVDRPLSAARMSHGGGGSRQQLLLSPERATLARMNGVALACPVKPWPVGRPVTRPPGVAGHGEGGSGDDTPHGNRNHPRTPGKGKVGRVNASESSLDASSDNALEGGWRGS